MYLALGLFVCFVVVCVCVCVLGGGGGWFVCVFGCLFVLKL